MLSTDDWPILYTTVYDEKLYSVYYYNILYYRIIKLLSRIILETIFCFYCAYYCFAYLISSHLLRLSVIFSLIAKWCLYFSLVLLDHKLLAIVLHFLSSVLFYPVSTLQSRVSAISQLSRFVCNVDSVSSRAYFFTFKNTHFRSLLFFLFFPCSLFSSDLGFCVLFFFLNMFGLLSFDFAEWRPSPTRSIHPHNRYNEQYHRTVL